MSDTIDPNRIEHNWQAITAELDAPPPSRVERLLLRSPLPARHVRVALATPSLARAWFVALALVVFIGLVSGDTDTPRDSLFGFLAVAPLVPLLGVAFSYGAESDPAHEIAVATPMRGLHLVLVRTGAVLTVSVGALLITSVLSPARSLLAVAWLLPAMAVTASALALATWFPARRASAIVFTTWLAVLTIVRMSVDDRLGAFTTYGQLLALGVAVVAAGVVAGRRDRFDVVAVGS